MVLAVLWTRPLRAMLYIRGEVIPLGNDILLVAEIVGALTVIGGLFVSVRKAVIWAKRITAGYMCQLRSDMLRIYYAHHKEEKIRQHEYENFVFCYEAYKNLGGNSFVDKIYGEVKKWEVLT